MNRERYRFLMEAPECKLTDEEIKQGWHYCFSEWDGLLVGPGMEEYRICRCDFSPHGKPQGQGELV